MMVTADFGCGENRDWVVIERRCQIYIKKLPFDERMNLFAMYHGSEVGA